MNTYLIQRNLPGAGKLSLAQQKSIAQRSCAVIEEIGHNNIEWIHSYITSDNLWCIYNANDEEYLKEHAKKGGFPLNNIFEIAGTFSPATAEVVI